jgi:outer membrane protein TolC
MIISLGCINVNSAEKNIIKKYKLPILDEKSSLKDYLKYAALNNPELRAVFCRWKASLKKITQAKGLPDPNLTYGYFIDEVETRVGAQKQKISLSQKLPFFGKRALKADIARHKADSLLKKLEAVKLNLFFKVKNIYYECYYLGKAIAIVKENIELLKYFEKVARTKYKTDIGKHPDIIKAQVELGKLEDRFNTLLDLQNPTMAKFNALLNRDIHASIPWPKKIAEENINADDRVFINRIKEKNPELKALFFNISSERKNIELARKNYFPDVTFGVQYIDTKESLMPATDSGKDPLMATVSINLPIWYKKYKSAGEEALARFSAAEKDYRNKENNLYYEIKSALYKFRDAKRKINLYRDALIPKGEQSLRAVEASYKVGKIDFLNLIDAQRLLLEFRLSLERALSNQAKYLAEIERLMGGKIDEERRTTATLGRGTRKTKK